MRIGRSGAARQATRRHGRAARVCALAALMAAILPTLGTTRSGPAPQVPMERTLAPAPGRLLLARPELDGPYFARSVVLLIDADRTGAMGVVLNRQTKVQLSELLPTLTKNDRPVFLGGPVQAQAIAFLFRSDSAPKGARRLIEGVHIGSSAGTLSHVVERELAEGAFRAYMGYAGWAPMQLEHEIARGSWWVLPANAELVFDTAPELLWQKLVREYGGVMVRRIDGPESSEQRGAKTVAALPGALDSERSRLSPRDGR